MTKREKVIVSLMGVAIVFGLYTALFTGNGRKKSPSRKQAQTTLEMITKSAGNKLFSNAPTPVDQYIIRLAEERWKKDPFIQSERLLNTAEPKKSSTKPIADTHPNEIKNLFYSGFLESSEKRMAIINGLEYEEGQQIKGTSYFIKQIFRYKVIIKRIKGSHEASLKWNKKGP